jgi:hypothetical protein
MAKLNGSAANKEKKSKESFISQICT